MFSGLVERTTPSVRRGSGVVNTSSVGRLGWCEMPSAVVNVAHAHSALGSRPTVRSVPSPLKWMASNRCSPSRSLISVSRSKRVCQAATGSSSSSRHTRAISCDSRSNA